MPSNPRPYMVSQREFAKLCNVSAPAICQACKKNTLKDTYSGGFIDLRHPDAVAYMRLKGIEPPSFERIRVKKTPKSESGQSSQLRDAETQVRLATQLKQLLPRRMVEFTYNELKEHFERYVGASTRAEALECAKALGDTSLVDQLEKVLQKHHKKTIADFRDYMVSQLENLQQ